MIYVTVLLTSTTHRELLQFQTRRQAHLPLTDVEEVVAGRLARPVRWREGRRPVVVEHACVRKVGVTPPPLFDGATADHARRSLYADDVNATRSDCLWALLGLVPASWLNF